MLNLLAARMTREDLLQDYPYLEAVVTTAVLEYAARQADLPVFKTA